MLYWEQMGPRSLRIVVLLALTLMVGAMRCAVACILEDCAPQQASSEKPADPPCHHHQQSPAKGDPASCAHQGLRIGAAIFPNVQSHVPVIAAPALPMTAISLPVVMIPRSIVVLSPPNLNVLSSVILRI
jgi:hypothetical protein